MILSFLNEEDGLLPLYSQILPGGLMDGWIFCISCSEHLLCQAGLESRYAGILTVQSYDKLKSA
jgi:hypothetical protein